jgi:hypothetical protein
VASLARADLGDVSAAERGRTRGPSPFRARCTLNPSEGRYGNDAFGLSARRRQAAPRTAATVGKRGSRRAAAGGIATRRSPRAATGRSRSAIHAGRPALCERGGSRPALARAARRRRGRLKPRWGRGVAQPRPQPRMPAMSSVESTPTGRPVRGSTTTAWLVPCSSMRAATSGSRSPGWARRTRPSPRRPRSDRRSTPRCAECRGRSPPPTGGCRSPHRDRRFRAARRSRARARWPSAARRPPTGSRDHRSAPAGASRQRHARAQSSA